MPDEVRLVTTPLIESLPDLLAHVDVVLFNEFLEAVHEPACVLRGLAEYLRPDTMVAVAFANMDSVGSRALRRRWRSFFDKKVAFYDAANLEALMWRQGFRRLNNDRLASRYSGGYVAKRLNLSTPHQEVLAGLGLDKVTTRLTSGRELITFAAQPPDVEEKLSIIVPVYNEARYVGAVLTGLLQQELPIGREIIVVESGSTDGSREIVRRFEHMPGMRVILQDRPRGKGNAVRAGLECATGTIFLIQDADFEYDLDDYESLLEPLLLRRTSFVLGSRSLGLDDWKVRRYRQSRLKELMLNSAQVVFARTFNALYQQRVTDINTMLKVFRRECMDGLHFTGDRFDFDIELVCKLVRNGYEPFEVPVNYVARSFDEGKKVSFVRDAIPSYYQLFRSRVGSL